MYEWICNYQKNTAASSSMYMIKSYASVQNVVQLSFNVQGLRHRQRIPHFGGVATTSGTYVGISESNLKSWLEIECIRFVSASYHQQSKDQEHAHG
jgi:hypothetical protein